MRATGAMPSQRRRRLLAGAAGLAWPAWAQTPPSTPADPARLHRDWALPPDVQVTLDVGPQAVALEAACQGVRGWRVPATSRLVLRLHDGVHALARAVVWQHPDGARVALHGSDPARCTLGWPAGGDGFYVGAGEVLGGLDGVTLRQQGRGGNGSGLLADEGGVIRCGPRVRIDGFYYGVQARRNGTVRCEGVTVHDGGDANVFAFMGGHVHARRVVAEGARDEARRLGSGFVAEYGGTIDAEGAVARRNALDGFTALSNGVIRAYRSRAEGNARAGYFSDTGGRIVGHDAAAEGNCGDGVLTRDGARGFTAERFTTTGNGPAAAACPAPERGPR